MVYQIPLQKMKVILEASRRFNIYGKGKKLEREVLYQEAKKSFLETLSDLHKVVKGIPILKEEFLGKDPKRIDLNLNGTSPVTGQEYKGRLLCMVLWMLYLNTDCVVEGILELYGGASKKGYNAKVDALNQILTCVEALSEKMAKNKPYQKELWAIFELLSMADYENHEKSVEMVQTVKSELEKLDDLLDSGFFKGEREPDYVILHNLSLIGYLVATGNPKVKNMGMIPEEVHLKSVKDRKMVLEMLGEAVLGECHGDRSEMSTLYQAVMLSLPKFYYSYPEIRTNPSLREGCRIFSYVKMLSGYKRVNKYIEKVL